MIKPINNYILVTFKKNQETKTTGGIYVPQTVSNPSKDSLERGVVKAVSNQLKNKEIKVDDIVLYNKYAVSNIPREDSLVLVREEDVYCIEEQS